MNRHRSLLIALTCLPFVACDKTATETTQPAPTEQSAETASVNGADEAGPTSGEKSFEMGSAPAMEANDNELTARGIVRASLDDSPSAIEGRDLTVTFSARVGQDKWRAMTPGATLHSGDFMILEVDLKRSSHIYVLQQFADGTSAVLYPEAGEEDPALPPGKFRLPPKDAKLNAFQLDNETGTESLFVIASPKPLKEADGELHKLVTEVRGNDATQILKTGTASAPIAKADPEPSVKQRTKTAGIGKSGLNRAKASQRKLDDLNGKLGAELNARGIFRARVDGANIDAKSDDKGIAVVPFTFEHV